MSASEHVIIIGAGIGGLTAGLSLQRAGYRISVYEQAPEFGEIGAGIMLTPNATRVLLNLGLESGLMAKGDRPTASLYRKFDTAEIMQSTPLNDRVATYGAPQVHIHRADLHRTLLEAVAANDPSCLHTSHVCERVEQTAEGVRAVFANGTVAEGGVLVGCDGARSVVRAMLFGRESPRFTGQVAWRGLVPAAGLPDTVSGPASTVWIGPDRHVVQYGVRHGTYVNYVAVARTKWEEEGWNIPANVSDLLSEFDGWHPDLRALLAATPAGTCFKWGLFDREPADVWTQGRITLLGDAAHPMLPLMAQGSAMAIEDGCVLARCLSDLPVEKALQRYEHMRAPRAGGIILRSRAAAGLYQNVGGDKSAERQSYVDSIYTYDATTVAV